MSLFSGECTWMSYFRVILDYWMTMDLTFMDIVKSRKLIIFLPIC